MSKRAITNPVESDFYFQGNPAGRNRRCVFQPYSLVDKTIIGDGRLRRVVGLLGPYQENTRQLVWSTFQLERCSRKCVVAVLVQRLGEIRGDCGLPGFEYNFTPMGTFNRGVAELFLRYSVSLYTPAFLE